MTAVTDAIESDRIRLLVQHALDRRQPRGYRVEVEPDGILKEDNWYHVVVAANRDVRTYDFYDVLAEAEGELQNQEGLNILLVPTVAD